MIDEEDKFENPYSPKIFVTWWWIFCIILIIRSFLNRG